MLVTEVTRNRLGERRARRAFSVFALAVVCGAMPYLIGRYVGADEFWMGTWIFLFWLDAVPATFRLLGQLTRL